MKHTLLLSFLFLFTTGSFAQTQGKQKPQNNKQSTTQPKVVINPGNSAVKHDGIKPVMEVGGKLYDIAKAEGRLAHYELVQKEGKIISITKTDYTKLSPQSSGLTPCDVVPPGTIPAFGTPIDDATTPFISLPFTFCFYGNNYTQVRMSSNGNIQFPPTNNTAFSSTGFPAPNDIMIAPFWSDVDIRGTGTCTYDVFATYAVFSWINVGYYNTHSDLINDFQMVITDGTDPILPPGKNVGFYYGTMEWTTGDASGGTGGFPDPSTPPPIPATVGANAGNGIDYFLIGRFGQPGNSYDGPLGADDGVSWLNGKRFFFNGCPPIGANQEPLNLTGGYCDTLKVCGNDTLYKKYTFSAPEVSQSVTVTATAPTLGSAFSYSVLPNTNSTDVFMIIDGSLAPGGYHTVTMTATDNGTPVLSSVQTFVVYVNQAALSNLNGSIVITPTVGACPGGTVTTSVNITGGIPDSYLWSNNETTPATTYTTVVPADSLIFVTLTSGQCQKSIIGNININPVPVASISGALNYCAGNASSTILTATNTLNPSTQGPHTYNWSGTGTIGSANSASTTLTPGNYTVVVTNQFGCVSSAATTVVLNENPSYTITSLNAIAGGSVYCISQDTARYGINYGLASAPSCGFDPELCTTSNTVQIGTGTSTGSGTSYPCPYANFYNNDRQQYLYTAAELTSQGLIPGRISSLAFIVDNLPSPYIGTFPSYTIKMSCTSITDLTTTFEGGLTQVFSGPYTPVVGVSTHTLSQSFVWDGVSNILVDICTTIPPSAYTNNANVEMTTTSFVSANYFRDDNIPACGTTQSATTSNDRPNIIFSNCRANQQGNQFNVTVTPSVGVVVAAAHDSIMFDLPSSAAITCYTISIVNPINGGCIKDTVICINTTQGVTQATLNPSSATVCPSETITLSPAGTITSYTITYADGSGVHTSPNSPVTFTPSSVPGVFVYTLSATAPCGGPLTDFTTTVTVAQGVTQGTLATTNDSICPGTPVTLSAIGTLATYTIQYNTGSGLQTSVNSSVTIVPTNTTSPVFGVHTYSLIAQGFCGGPIDTFYVDVTVVQGVTQGTLATTNDSICPGTPVTLSALGALNTYTIQYNTGSGIQTSVNSPVTIVPTGTNSPVFGAHTYTLLANGPCSGPLDTFYVDVVVIQGFVPQITLNATPNPICIGSPVTLNVTGTSYSTYTISYYDGSGPHTTSSQVTFIPSTTGAITYSASADGFCNSPQSSTTTIVNVTALANLTIAPMPNVTKCLSGSTVLTANVSSNVASTTYTYAWTANGSLAPGTYTNSSYTSNATTTTTYVVGVIGSCASPATSSVVVTNFVNDISVSIIDSASVCANTELKLHAMASGGVPAYTYNWVLLPNVSSIGSGSELTTTSPGSEGTYTISVVVSDSCGYTDFDMQPVNVLPPCDIVIPNIITPNGDGANEAFKIKNLEYHPNTSLTIFDRWGRKVYDSSNYNNDWKGDGLNDGTFFYILDVPDDKKYNGYVTIFKGN